MFVILHHRDQHGFGDILLVVRLPPVQVEIIHAGTLERTDFTVEGLYLVVNITDVFLQVGQRVERLLTLGTDLIFLSWPHVNCPNVTHPTRLPRQLFTTIVTDVLFVTVNPFYVFPHIRFCPECHAAVSAENLLFIVFMKL